MSQPISAMKVICWDWCFNDNLSMFGLTNDESISLQLPIGIDTTLSISMLDEDSGLIFTRKNWIIVQVIDWCGAIELQNGTKWYKTKRDDSLCKWSLYVQMIWKRIAVCCYIWFSFDMFHMESMLNELQCISYNDMIHKDTEHISTSVEKCYNVL